MLGGLDARLKLLVSALAVLVLVVPLVALFRDVLGWEASAALIAASWAGFYLLMTRLAAAALTGLVKVAEAIEKASEAATGEGGEGEEDFYIAAGELEGIVDDPEGELLVWALADTLYKAMGGNEDLVVSVVDDGIPVTAYPPERYMYVDSEEAESQEPPRAVRDPDTGVALVTLSPSQFRLLARAAKAGEGESVVVRDDETLEALYSMARALAEVVAGPSPLASYVAYKAILKASRRGAIRFDPEDLLDKLPLEDAATRRRIREQVSEELRLHHGGEKNAKQSR